MTIPMKTRKNGITYYDRPADIARHESIRNGLKFGRLKPFAVTSCIPGESWHNFTDDPDEVVLLGKACRKFGWEEGVCTVSKALKYHGRPNPDYEGHGWLVKYADYVYKRGERAGQTREGAKTVVYPLEAFVWDTESGLPEFDEERQAEREARKAAHKVRTAERELRKAKKAAGIETERPKAEPIHDEPVAAGITADVAALTKTINALLEQNAQLIAMLGAKQ